MKLNNKEKRLLRLIKIVPIIIVLIFSFIITFILVDNNIHKHNKKLSNIKQTYINEQKRIVKDEVLRVVRQINYNTQVANKELKKDLEFRVKEIHKIISIIYNKNIDKSKEEILSLIKDILRPIRFYQGRGYFFINSMDGTTILHPISPHLEGKNMINIKDKNNISFIKDFLNVKNLKNKEGFTKYYWTKPNEKEDTYSKISFSKYFEPLDFVISAGEYEVDFEEGIKKRLINEIQQLRYGKNGYIFIHQYDGLCLTHIKEENIGKYRLNIKDREGSLIVQDVINLAKKGAGFIDYIGTINPDTGLPAKKISYIVGIDKWQWQIGAGAYISDIDKVLIKMERKFSKRLNKTILFSIFMSILLTLIILCIMYLFSRRVSKEFIMYKESIEQEIQNTKHKEVLLFEQSKMASMGNMIANISHQWRQPLSVISTAASGVKLNQDFGTLDDDDIRTNMDEIIKSTQYLSETINIFRDFIKEKKEIKEVILQDRIDMTMKIVSAALENNHIEVINNIYNIEPIKITMVVGELSQVIINIINNAKDSLVFNNIKEPWIKINVEQQHDRVIVTIEDNGGGIKEDILPMIFDPYFTTKHKSQGTGLGLHISYQIIHDSLGGEIYANNTVNGVKFFIELPLR